MTTFGKALADARATLRAAGVESAGLDSRLLLADAAGLDMARLIGCAGEEMPDAVRETFAAHVERRRCGEPVDRILGVREFWGLPFRIDASTLAPRPETECLVEAVLTEAWQRGGGLTICDLGTGSGAIVVALLTELPQARALAIDLSPGALKMARINAQAHGVAGRIRFRLGDFAQEPDEAFDVVVANPPYIGSGEIGGLDSGVRDHDPHMALDGGPDGLDAYRNILARVDTLMKPGGFAAFEIGRGQDAAVMDLCRAAGLGGVRLRRDLAGIGRVVMASMPPDSAGRPAKKALGKVV